MPKPHLTQTKGKALDGKKKADASKARSNKTDELSDSRKKLKLLLRLDASEEEEDDEDEEHEDGDGEDEDGDASEEEDAGEGDSGDEPEPEPEPKPKRKGKGKGKGKGKEKEKEKGSGAKKTKDDGLSPLARQRRRNEPPTVRQLRGLDVKASLAIRQERGIELIYQATRVLIRHLTEYCNPTHVLIDGLLIATMGEDCRKPSEIRDQFDQLILGEMLWPQVCKWLPQLETHADIIVNDANLMTEIGDYISGVAKKTRSDDLPRVKAEIIGLLHIKDVDHVLRDKANRGFNNITTGRLLCPASDLDEFDEDPSRYCRLAKLGQKLILSEDWFTLCYDERLRKPNDPKAGLFRNIAGVKCYKLIFTGKGSAMDDYYDSAYKGKRPVAVKAKLEKVTIGSIIHVFLLMRFALNSQVQWQQTDGKNWDGAAFARSIFEAAFESPKWAEELESWWTRKVFGKGQEDTEELQARRKCTALALFKTQSERSVLRNAESHPVREVRPPASQSDVYLTNVHTENSQRMSATHCVTSNARAADSVARTTDEHVRAADNDAHAGVEDARAADDDARMTDDDVRMTDDDAHAGVEDARTADNDDHMTDSVHGDDARADEDDGQVYKSNSSITVHPDRQLTKRDADLEPMEPEGRPTKRPRPVPKKKPEQHVPLNTMAPFPQSTAREDVEDMYTA